MKKPEIWLIVLLLFSIPLGAKVVVAKHGLVIQLSVANTAQSSEKAQSTAIYQRGQPYLVP